MRRPLLWTLASALSVGLLVPVFGQTNDASKILAATREALGGDQKLAATRTFVATGRTRQVQGDNLVPIEFEISCELPDRYVRRDEIPAKESGPTSTGFNGEGLIQLPAPPEPAAAPATKPASPAAKPASPPATGTAAPAPTAQTPATAPTSATTPAVAPATGGAALTPPTSDRAFKALEGAAGSGAVAPKLPIDPRKAKVTSVKQDFVRMTLGMFATSFSTYPLTFKFAGQAEAPQGKADMIDVKGPDEFSVRLFVNSETHLPIMVSWTKPATNVVMTEAGQPAPQNVPPGSVVVQAPARPAAGASKEEQAKYVADLQELRKKAMTRPVEYRIYYADYRDVGNGIKFPFRLRKAVGGETTEETNFDAYKINARIDPRKFEALK